MKKLTFRKRNTKTRIIVISALTVLLASLLFFVVKIANDWFETHRLQFNPPVQITFNPVVEVQERRAKITQIINTANELPVIEELTPIEEYICDKWGAYDCKVALAVARAESGLREGALNVNTNKSIDIGIFQINSIHYGKDGCGLKDVVDQYKNVDCAYQIWQDSGWNAWAVFNNGSFKGNL